MDRAALAVTLAEMLKFGKEYARQIVSKAKSLAAALDRQGLDVKGKLKAYMQSHTILVNVSRFGSAPEIADVLERANIICSAFTDCFCSPSHRPREIRLSQSDRENSLNQLTQRNLRR